MCTCAVMDIAAVNRSRRKGLVIGNILRVGRDLRAELLTAAAFSAAVMRCWDNSLCVLKHCRGRLAPRRAVETILKFPVTSA